MIILSLGTFDPLHSGHIGLFKQCRRLAGLDGTVIIGVNSDEFVLKYKQVPPLIPEEIRLDLIDHLFMVDKVVLNHGGDTQAELIEKINPDVLLIGLDWAFKDYYSQLGISQKWLDERDIQLVYVPRTGDWSSSEIKETHDRAIRSNPDAGLQH